MTEKRAEQRLVLAIAAHAAAHKLGASPMDVRLAEMAVLSRIDDLIQAVKTGPEAA